MNKKIIVISAVWCPSCLILKKDLKKVRNDYPTLEIETLDYDFDSEDVKKYNVGDKLPVIISFIDNQEVKRLIGEKNYDEIVEFLKESKVVWKR